MPQIFRMGEYWIYFWTNENKPVEPFQNGIHISEKYSITVKYMKSSLTCVMENRIINKGGFSVWGAQQDIM